MRTYRTTLTPLSAFGTPPKGDSLFGQLCWALRNRLGEERLTHLLDGYTAGRPFAVVSDAFPAGHLPRPALPGHWFTPLPGDDRKAAKKRVWLPEEHVATPVTDWLQHCRPTNALPGGAVESHPHPHNAIDRRTGTTGEGFAPYTMGRHWYDAGAALDLHIVLDDTRLPATDLEQALRDIGELGFGRDAGIGLGRFRIDAFVAADLPAQAGANAWLTLAPCAPQGLAWNAERCFYTVFTRFGRHGDIGVHQGNPFKAPVLLANTGAVLTPCPQAGQEGNSECTAFRPISRLAMHRQPWGAERGPGERAFFTGQGLGGISANGQGSLSKTIPATVHQGYAPVIGIELPKGENDT